MSATDVSAEELVLCAARGGMQYVRLGGVKYSVMKARNRPSILTIWIAHSQLDRSEIAAV